MRGYLSTGRKLAYLGALALVVASMFMFGADKSEAAAGSYIDLDNHASQKALSAGREDRVVVRRGTARLGASPHRSGSLYWGRLTSKVYRPSTKFDTVVPSWNARTPAGTFIKTQVQVFSGSNWSRWFNMGVWAQGTRDIKRRSINGQDTSRWQVNTDTLQSKGRVFASAYRYRATLYTKKRSASPRINALSFVSSNSYRHGSSLDIPPLKRAWGKDLRVPVRSQMVYSQGEAWCSPTTLSMIMAYWANKTGRRGLNQTVPTVARGVYDYTYRGWGNWSFNTSYAASRGLSARVSRFSQLAQIERWTDMGIPVTVSIAWDNRTGIYGTKYRLVGAPLQRSNGHILLVRGFTRSGHVIVNDPAASGKSGVRRVYRRNEFARAWLKNHANRYGNYGNGGVVYLVHPTGKRIPYQYAARGSW